MLCPVPRGPSLRWGDGADASFLLHEILEAGGHALHVLRPIGQARKARVHALHHIAQFGAAELVADAPHTALPHHAEQRSEEHTSELQSLMRISYAVFCLTKKKNTPK